MRTLAAVLIVLIGLSSCMIQPVPPPERHPDLNYVVRGLVDDGLITEEQGEALMAETEEIDSWPDFLWRLGELGLAGGALWFGLNRYRNRTRRRALEDLPKR